MRSSFYLFFTLLFFVVSVNGHSQENSRISKQNLYFELGTNVLISSVSVNFEQYLLSSSSGNVNLYGRVGAGGAMYIFSYSGWGGLGALTMITGKGDHHFELSGGVFVGSENNTYASPNTFFLPLFDVGYRHQKPGSGFIFRLKAGVLGFGVGLGYAF